MNSTKRPYKFLLPGSFVLVFLLIVLASLSSQVWATPSQSPSGQTGPTATSTVTPTLTSTPVPPPGPTIVVTVVLPPAITAIPEPTRRPPGRPPVSFVITAVQPDVDTTVDASENTEAKVKTEIPARTFAETRQVIVVDLNDPEEVAAILAENPLPAGIAQARKPFEIKVADTSGATIDNPKLNECITIKAGYDAGDVAAAGGNEDLLRLIKRDGRTGDWVILTTRNDRIRDELSAPVCSTLSVFAIGVKAAPQVVAATPAATATAIPPAPGDVSPSSNLLIGLMVAGIILAISGAFYLRTARREEES